MRSFQQNRKWKNVFESWPVLLCLGILLLFLMWVVIGFLSKMQTTRENRRIAESKVLELRDKKEKLSSDIENLKTDAGKEQIFRENFGLAKEGEGLIVVVDDKNASKVEEEKHKSFLSLFFFWEWFD